MSFVTFTTRNGTPWTPKYLTAIDQELCIGCGRCYKVCTMGVLKLMGTNEDGDMCDPFDDDDGEIERKVMTIDNAGNCIGCSSCNAVCGTNAQKHEALAA
ncbi:ferredoxin III, nif-specific [Magnetospirillum sp. UT-4]|uniref:ferredoxin III, nif-specific n=1 Tax=Magnetospirillum sp. UT-4 TaxID=2681467 RepID=UPI00137FACAA|nr:ferredoxin III, nif-specific [Magnetospirillum sp. UT-4]CAA7615283.1 putative ferredoxin-3 [Magnetospirillum sp. UT-4]